MIEDESELRRGRESLPVAGTGDGQSCDERALGGGDHDVFAVEQTGKGSSDEGVSCAKGVDLDRGQSGDVL